MRVSYFHCVHVLYYMFSMTHHLPYVYKGTPPILILLAIILNSELFTRYYYECGIPGSVISEASRVQTLLFLKTIHGMMVPKMAFNA